MRAGVDRGILVLASGARWESELLTACAAAGVPVLSRCVDVVDLMAAATLGQAGAAVVDADLPRLDADAIGHLHRYDVRVLAVVATGDESRVRRLGAAPVPAGAAEILAALNGLARTDDLVTETQPTVSETPVRGRPGRVVAVWGPAGAPGRSTLALAVAAELAAAGRRTVLVDADPGGGSIAQQVGLLDEVSGLLVAARRVNVGTLDPPALAAACRRVGTRLEVLTGLPRPDRRVEVRAGVLETVLGAASELADVVVDAGSGIEDGQHDRDRMSVDALGSADQIVVVGAVDPIGLGRLTRSLSEVRERFPRTPVRVVLNKARGTVRWDRSELDELVRGQLEPVGIHLVPEDRETLDRALVSGRTVVELGTSPVRTAFAEVTRAVFPDAFEVRTHRARRRWYQAPKRR